MTGLALIEHGLQLALVPTVDPSSEQVGSSFGAADQHAQFAGALEQRLQRRRASENDIGGQLHLGHAVAIARPQCRALSWAERGHQTPHPVGAASLHEGCIQAIGGGLQRGHIGHTQKGIVVFAEAHPGASQLLGDE